MLNIKITASDYTFSVSSNIEMLGMPFEFENWFPLGKNLHSASGEQV